MGSNFSFSGKISETNLDFSKPFFKNKSQFVSGKIRTRSRKNIFYWRAPKSWRLPYKHRSRSRTRSHTLVMACHQVIIHPVFKDESRRKFDRERMLPEGSHRVRRVNNVEKYTLDNLLKISHENVLKLCNIRYIGESHA